MDHRLEIGNLRGIAKAGVSLYLMKSSNSRQFLEWIVGIEDSWQFT
jgi:hypothetical protein